MQEFPASVALGVLLLIGVYELLVVAPRLRAMNRKVGNLHRLFASDGSAGDALTALEMRTTTMETHLSALDKAVRSRLGRVGFVRFDAFPDVRSHLSFALALLDDGGHGIVLSSIWSREETRTYGKTVSAFAIERDGSAEERQAVARAREAA